MKVVIVGRTRMRDGHCIGGINAQTLRNVRLVPAVGHSHSPDAPYDVGDVWDIPVAQLPFHRPPHVEDVRVAGSGTWICHLADVGTWLTARLAPWSGSPTEVFGGCVRRNGNGRAYVGEESVPLGSVGFWFADRRLLRQVFGENGAREYYDYIDVDGARWRFSYSGIAPSLKLIPAGTLVRLSLARWWAPADGNGKEACWAQVSGWFPTSARS